jgi:hypothetical protein
LEEKKAQKGCSPGCAKSWLSKLELVRVTAVVGKKRRRKEKKEKKLRHLEIYGHGILAAATEGISGNKVEIISQQKNK